MSGFDYYVVGQKQDFGTHIFTADEIVAFARKFDPQPFHIDAEAARDSLFGGLCASGWHTGAMWMRKMCDFREKDFERHAAEHGEKPILGPSPGIKDMRWLRPVFAGETIRFGCEIASCRALKSKPGWGMVSTRNFAETVEGTTVMTFESAVMVRL